MCINQNYRDMKTTLLVVGRTVEQHYITAINDYIQRTKRYITFDMEVIPELKNTKSLPMEVQKMISDGTGIPLEKIYGVVTFYSQFSLSPKGKYRISVCLGTACYVKGSGDIYNALMEKLGIVGGECTPDGKFSLDACRCVGACGLAPVMMVNDEVYGRLTVDDIDDILAKYE